MKNKLKIQDRFRLLVQCLSFAFHNGYVRGWAKGRIYTGNNKTFCVPGLNCYSCPGALGSCPIGSLQAVLDSGQYHVSMYVLGFIGIVGMLCGRFVCGWLCPFGLVQDLIYKIPFVKKIKNLPGHKYLRYLRFVILAVFVIALPMGVKNQSGVGQPWFCEYICPSGTLLAGIPLVILNPALRAEIGPRFIWKVFLLLVVVVLCLLSYRPFCKYVCPLGALYGAANPVSLYRFKVDQDACVSCGACQKVCGMDIKVWEKPNSMDCIRCGKCIAACPKSAISTTFPLKKKTGEEMVNTIPESGKNVSELEKTAVNPLQTAAEPVQTLDEPLQTAAEPVQTLVEPLQTAAEPAQTKVEKKKQKVRKPAGTVKRVFSAVMGMGCIGIGVGALYLGGKVVKALLQTGSGEDLATIGEYLLSPMICIIPAILMIILGIGLVVSVGKKSLYENFRTWPKKIIITLLECIAANYILNVVDVVLLVKTIDSYAFVCGVAFMASTGIVFVYPGMLLILAITALVVK